MKDSVKPYSMPLVTEHILDTSTPVAFDVNASQVEEVSEGEVGAHSRDGFDAHASGDKRNTSDDAWGSLW